MEPTSTQGAAVTLRRAPQIDIFVAGPLETNTYLLRFSRESWIIDPGMGLEEMTNLLRSQGPPPARILLTHGHGDHIAGIAELKAAFPSICVSCLAADANMLASSELNLSAPFGFDIVAPAPDELLAPGMLLMVDDFGWEVLDTSGHSPGGASYYSSKAGVVFTGDSLFADSIGRTDIPGARIALLLDNIKNNLLTLPDTTRVFPGHGPATTIGRERWNNPYLAGLK
jgi:glyoxylase-like metal-dependent hydrolase (beta-lactamase superfamily II)